MSTVDQEVRGHEGGLWLCPKCRGIHPERRCPHSDWPDGAPPTCLDGPLHLCPCCSRVPVAHESPQSSFFCPDCGPRIDEVNRAAERTVVPVSRESRGDVTVDRQIRRLAEASYRRTASLLWDLRIQEPVWVPLTDYLARVAELRAERFQPPAALQELLDMFCDFVLETPDESPALRARIRDTARLIVRKLHAVDARALRARGPAALRDFSRARASERIDAVLPIPSSLLFGDLSVGYRRAPTVQALTDAIVEAVERAHGPAHRPLPPVLPPDLQIVVQAKPGEEWPDEFPDRPSEEAHLIVGLRGTPSAPEAMLSAYQLSQDKGRRQWILWAEVEDEVEPALITAAPAAWCPAEGLSAADAAYAVLAAFLTAERRTHGVALPRPQFEMQGLLDEDLVNVLLDRVWEVESAPAS